MSSPEDSLLVDCPLHCGFRYEGQEADVLHEHILGVHTPPLEQLSLDEASTEQMQARIAAGLPG